VNAKWSHDFENNDWRKMLWKNSFGTAVMMRYNILVALMITLIDFMAGEL
jgi:hypothetical protein